LLEIFFFDIDKIKEARNRCVTVQKVFFLRYEAYCEY
jgi:hypothetical protein